NDFGEGASCAVANGTVLVPWDHEGDSALYALDAGTGETKWKVDRDERTTWTTPVVTRVNGTDQVLMPGTNACIAYDLKSGKELWRTKGLTVNVIPTTIVKDGIAYMTSGYRGSSLVAIDLAKASAGAGNDAILWEHDRATPYVPSPALLGDDIYFLRSNSGVLSSINIDTGKPNYQGQRLDDVRNVYSSIGIAAGHLFICGREGGTAIVKAGDNFELVRINRLDEGINASPVFVGGDLLIRTRSTLYCFSKAGA
ncbi:MAG: PQQ-binding-like beta-propeller repeat protein, partial [Planctomycetota bacterium]